MNKLWRRFCATPLLAAIYLWRYLLSPIIPPSCRFSPSCSEYAIEAIACYGAWRGGMLTYKRVLRCHPFSKHWGYDPVPAPVDPADPADSAVATVKESHK